TTTSSERSSRSALNATPPTPVPRNPATPSTSRDWRNSTHDAPLLRQRFLPGLRQTRRRRIAYPHPRRAPHALRLRPDPPHRRARRSLAAPPLSNPLPG